MKRIIFLHGVGSNGASMRALGQELGSQAEMHFPDAPQPFPRGQGRQWFSVEGVTEANRPARVADALPAFDDVIERFGDPADSLLIGFSQGSIMALHAVAAGLPSAGVVALSGRLAGAVPSRAEWPPVWLLHGSADPVMPPDVARATEAWLREAGAAPNLQIFEGLGHSADARTIAAMRAAIGVLEGKDTPGER